MEKKKTPLRKLTIDSETLRRLTKNDMVKIKGAAPRGGSIIDKNCIPD